jgi:hypothetical protein
MSSAASSTSTETDDEIKLTARQQVFYNLLGEILSHMEKKRDYLNCGLVCQAGFPVVMRELYQLCNHSQLTEIWSEHGCPLVRSSKNSTLRKRLTDPCCFY